ncbi:MAG: hypothetical protein ABSA33_02250 [Candidatus Micrarchaeaceae archaeon]
MTNTTKLSTVTSNDTDRTRENRAKRVTTRHSIQLNAKTRNAPGM